jgi:hypothetical protein
MNDAATFQTLLKLAEPWYIAGIGIPAGLLKKNRCFCRPP